MTLAKPAQCEKSVAGKPHGCWFGDARAMTLMVYQGSRASRYFVRIEVCKSYRSMPRTNILVAALSFCP